MATKNVRLIDADALLQTISDMCCADNNVKTRQIVDSTLHNLMPQIISDEPTVDAKPVKRGKWISEKVQKKDWKGIERSYFQPNSCSVCHIGVAVRTKFCPNCGARMEVDEDEQTQ